MADMLSLDVENSSSNCLFNTIKGPWFIQYKLSWALTRKGSQKVSSHAPFPKPCRNTDQIHNTNRLLLCIYSYVSISVTLIEKQPSCESIQSSFKKTFPSQTFFSAKFSELQGRGSFQTPDFKTKACELINRSQQPYNLCFKYHTRTLLVLCISIL